MATTIVGTGAEDVVDAIVTARVHDPFPLYTRARELDGGVHWSSALNGWVVCRYADVHAMCCDHETFSNDYFYETPAGIHDPGREQHRRYIAISCQQFMVKDPPLHTRIRAVLRPGFTPRAISDWTSRVERITDETLDQFSAGDQIDIMPAVAVTIPITVIASILGVPDEDLPKFRSWTDGFVGTFSPLIQGPERDQAIATTLTLFDYLGYLLERRRNEPADDLISLLATTSTADGERLETSNAVAQIALLLVAGNETTTNLIGSTVSLLLQNPAAKEQLLINPGLISNAIEEALRCDPPFHLDVRKATRDCDLGGKRVRAGQLCYQLLAAANRDPRHFDRAETFDVTRPTNSNRHLAFSHGVHFCLGAPLARLEGQTVLRKLLERFPDLSEGDEPAVRKTDAVFSRGWQTRPVRL